MSWFKKKFVPEKQPVEKRIEVVQVKSNELRIEQWRSKPEFVAAAQELFKLPTFQMMMDVLRTESPTNYKPTNEGQNATADLEKLGEIRGYHAALNTFELLRSPLKQNKPLVATFGIEPEQTK